MPDRNCYLVETASVPIGLLRDNAEYDTFEPANNQNCLKSVDCFFVENDNYEFILKHLYIWCKILLLKLLRVGFNKLSTLLIII